jgi:hypothetical protein
MKDILARLTHRIPLAAALAALLLVGALVALAAPRGSATSHRTQQSVRMASTLAPTVAEVKTAAPTVASNVVVADQVNPASTTVPTVDPTQAVAPTATPPPAPTPTATQPPAPSWHLVGNYSGAAQDPAAEIDLATLHDVTTKVQIDWTCQLQTSPAGVDFGIAPVGQSGIMGFGLDCEQGNCSVGGVTCNGTTMSGVWTPSLADTGDANWLIYTGSTAAGSLAPWTATVLVWD